MSSVFILEEYEDGCCGDPNTQRVVGAYQSAQQAKDMNFGPKSKFIWTVLDSGEEVSNTINKLSYNITQFALPE